VLLVLYMCKKIIAGNHHLGPQRLHPQKHIPYHLSEKEKLIVRKDEPWDSYEIFQYIKFIYSEMWFNFPHFIFFTQCKIICVSISKNPRKLRIPDFSFLLPLTRQKWPSLAFIHPHKRKGNLLHLSKVAPKKFWRKILTRKTKNNNRIASHN